MSRCVWLLTTLAGVLLMPMLALTQDAQPGRGEGRPRGGLEPAQMRERVSNNIREQLGASDDQWDVLAPKVEKVMTAQRELRGAGDGPNKFGGFGGPGGSPGRPPGDPSGGPPNGPVGRGDHDRGGGADNQPLSKVAQAQRDLRTTLESGDSSEAEIAKKLAAYRVARDKARAELEAAQKDLKVAVDKRQEAVLVIAGLLE